MTDERRTQKRFSAANTATHLRVEDDIRALGLEVSDVSLTGAYVRTEEPLEAGTRVELELVAKGLAKTIRVTGTVVNGRGDGMGVQFDPPLGDAAEHLARLIASISEPSPVSGGAEESTPGVLMAQVRTLLGDLDETLLAISSTEAAIQRTQAEIAALRSEIHRHDVQLAVDGATNESGGER